jgi:hypothetical protein
VLQSSGKYPVPGSVTFTTHATWVSNLCTWVWHVTNTFPADPFYHGILTDYSNCEGTEDASGTGSQTNVVLAKAGLIYHIDSYYYVGTLYLDASISYQPDECGTRTISYDRNYPNNPPTRQLSRAAACTWTR